MIAQWCVGNSWRLAILLAFLGHLATAQENREIHLRGAQNSTDERPRIEVRQDQAAAILAELQQIRRLLEEQRAQFRKVFESPVPQSEAIHMKVATDLPSMGDSQSPVTIVEFADLQCAFCRSFHGEVFPALKQNYIDTGKVRFVSRDLPLGIHPYAFKAAESTHCAGDQGRFWEMRSAMLESVVPLTEDRTEEAARSLHLDLTKFQECMRGETHKNIVNRDIDAAMALQINGTPAFIIARTRNDTLEGISLIGAQSYSGLKDKIDELLKSPSADVR